MTTAQQPLLRVDNLTKHFDLDRGFFARRGAVFADEMAGPASDATRLGSELAARLVAAGAGKLL